MANDARGPKRLARRTFLGAAVAACTVGMLRGLARAAPCEGPALFFVGGEIAAQGTPGVGYSTYARHRAVGTAGGMDFDVTEDDEVYPVAAGVVTAVASDPVAGRFLTVDHGFYTSLYAHLAVQFARLGQRVSRGDLIARAGQTGYGAWLGPHLHLGVKADRIVYLSAAGSGKAVYGNDVWLDPVDFAACEALDVHGNRTLPYWRGLDRDGDMDGPYRTAWQETRQLVHGAMDELAGVSALALSDTAEEHDARFGERLRRAWEAPGLDRRRRDEIDDVARAFFRAPFRLTAPLRDGGARARGYR